MMNQKLLLTHDLGANAKATASTLTHCSVSGHTHTAFGISYHADCERLNWSMVTGWLGDGKAVAFRYNKANKKKRPIVGAGAVIGSKYRALVVSDLHFPYCHPDAIKFLVAIKDEYELNKVICVGDILDHHYTSYHEFEFGAYSPTEELKRSQDLCQELESHFPKMLISEGNHDIMAKRKAKTSGIPEEYLRTYNEFLGIGNGWKWADSHYIEIGDAQPTLLPMIMKHSGRWNGKVL